MNNVSDRVSHHIQRRPAVNIHHAERYSRHIGFPLNRFVTINFSHTLCKMERASHEFRRLLAQRFAPWLRRTKGSTGVPPTYVWALEAAGGKVAVHWMVHIPAGLRRTFEAKIRQWLTGMMGQIELQAVKVQAVHNPVGLRRYILKGTEPFWAAHLNVEHVPQGVIVGKRSGFSENLGPTARKLNGYRPQRIPFARLNSSDLPGLSDRL